MHSYRHLLFSGCCSALAVAAGAAAAPSSSDFNWDTISPSSELQYQDCYNSEFKCARLNVPLDWLNQNTDTRKATIAIVKIPAVVPDSDPAFAGSIFTNPGGPGVAGVDFILEFGQYLRGIVDLPGRRHYEVISFDPRGIGRTLPVVNCFPNDTASRTSFDLENRGNGAYSRGDDAIAYGLAMYRGFGAACQQAADALPFVNTPSVARDMVYMVDQIEELRNKGENCTSNPQSGNSTRSTPSPKDSVTLAGEPGNVPRLNYIGFSYGTILGNYFASMFPGRVGRMILDGVCDANDYAKGPGWLNNIVDAEEVFDQFFEGCATAGPNVCPLAEPGDHGASNIRTRFDKFLADLDKNPQGLLVPPARPYVISGSDIRSIIGILMYSPTQNSQNLAYLISAVMSGNMTIISTVAGSIASGQPSLEEGQHSVVCIDGDDVSGEDLSYWTKYVHQLLHTSPNFGSIWAQIRLPCVGWKTKANWSFKGPFTTPRADASLAAGRPESPIFFLSNRLDPVAPLRSAQAMSALHPGSSVLVQETMGHAALFSAISNCTRDAVAEYFSTGKIPSTRSCDVPCGPWDASCPTPGTLGGGSSIQSASKNPFLPRLRRSSKLM